MTCSMRVKGRIVPVGCSGEISVGFVTGDKWACSTSWRVIRPPGPLPCTDERFVPRLAAALAATGVIRIGVLLPWLRTFQATIRPPGPLPDVCRRSTPSLMASLRAAGLALTLPAIILLVLMVGEVSGVSPDPERAATGSGLIRSAARVPFSETASPSLTIRAMTVPTGTVAPTGNRILPSTPLSAASTSTVDLSVSISKSGSPATTFWPSALRQPTRVPSSMVRPMRGITTSLAISASFHP